MTPRVFPPLIEVFLLVEQPRQRLSHWSRALAPLDGPGAPPVATVDAYYDPTSNQALFGLRYDELALGPDRLRLLVEVSVLAEITMIQPAELSEGDRKRFVTERLARCTVHVGDQRTIVSALVELVRRVRAHKPSTSPLTVEIPPIAPGPLGPRPRTANPARPRTAPGVPGAQDGSGTSSPSDLGDRPLVTAKGTREGEAAAVEPQLARSSRDLARGSVRQPRLERAADPDDSVVAEEHDDALADAVTEPARHKAGQVGGAPAIRRDDGPRPSPNVVTRAGVHRANTVTMSTSQTQRMIEAVKAPGDEPSEPPAESPTERMPAVAPPAEPPRIERRASTRGSAPLAEPPRVERRASTQGSAPPAEPPRIERRASTQGSAPLAELPAGGGEPDVIYARYLRDGRWVPVRIGALSLRRATLMAGALPRLDDRVDVALAYANHRAMARGTVTKVSTRQEAATTGAAAFSLTFELDDHSRRQLTALLTAARAANVTIKPAPPRSTRRYPVEWPISLGTVRGTVRAEALDVSTDGMFVKPLHPLTIDASLTFTAVLDDGLAPVTGRSRVVRSVSDSEAQAAGLLSGYGLAITEMAEPDRARWCAFLARIEKRAGKRVLIGASPARLAELQGGLVAAGYAVTGGTDAGAIAQLASADARPVDAALVDAAWIADGQSAAWVESLFSARNVPCVTIHGDARRARIAIDRLLSVV